MSEWVRSPRIYIYISEYFSRVAEVNTDEIKVNKNMDRSLVLSEDVLHNGFSSVIGIDRM